MIMSKKDKRWYTYRTPVGKIEIKVSKDIPYNIKGTYMFRYMRPDEIEWRYFSPSKHFNDVFHLITHIIKHTECAGTKFKILSVTESGETPFE